MAGLNAYLDRRTLLAASLEMGLFMLPVAAQASSPVDLDAINTPAIKFRNPAGAFLVAITRTANRLVAVGEHGIIIYSDDNGGTWSQASVPVDVTLTCVAFATPVLGWAAGASGIILNTADGGQTWQKQLDGVQANQLTLAAAQNSVDQNSTVPGAALALRRADYFVQSGPSKPFLSMLVLSPREVIVFGAYRMVMMTADGGKTWMDWSLHIYDRLSHDLYAGVAWGTDIYVTSEVGLIFRSADGGNSFPPLTSPSSATLFGLLGAADGSILVFGVAGNIFRSVDYGQTWLPVDIGTQDNLLAGRVLRSKEILVVSEAGGLFASKDNGVTFQAIPNLPAMTIFDLEEAANGDLALIGDSGVTVMSAAILSI